MLWGSQFIDRRKGVYSHTVVSAKGVLSIIYDQDLRVVAILQSLYRTFNCS